jgi:hypothetical protein
MVYALHARLFERLSMRWLVYSRYPRRLARRQSRKVGQMLGRGRRLLACVQICPYIFVERRRFPFNLGFCERLFQ